MKKGLTFVTLAAAMLMALTPLSANAKSKPSYSSKYWSSARYVKLSHNTKASEYKVTVKNKKLSINNKKVLKKATIKKGTVLYARSLGNGGWQVYNNDYPSSQKGVWMINNKKTTSWFKLAKQPKAVSKYWQSSRYATTTKNVTGIFTGVTVKNKKLTINNKKLKQSTIPKGTKLYARSMGNGTWQINNTDYAGSNKGVWLVKETDANWLKKTTAPKAISKYWSTNRYVQTTKAMTGYQYKVTVKDKKLNITSTVNKQATIPSGTKMYVRNMGNGSWQVYNSDYPSNNSGVWLVKSIDTSWFKKTAAPKAPTVYTSQYSKVSSDTISTDSKNPSIAYAPFGYKPISLNNGAYTVNSGQKVSVYSDTDKKAWVIIDNNTAYALSNSNNYAFSTANSQYVPNTNNTNIESLYAPDDPAALVPSGYSPQNGKLWLQLNSDGSVKQYYYYSTSDKNNPGWIKAKVEQQNGKSTIVAE